MPDVRPKIHPSIESRLSHTISTPTRIRSAFFLRRTQLVSTTNRKPEYLEICMRSNKSRHRRNKVSIMFNISHTIKVSIWPVGFLQF